MPTPRAICSNPISSLLDISHRGATLTCMNTNFLPGQARFLVESLAPRSADMPPLPADRRSCPCEPAHPCGRL